jgi:DNA-binding beta-propeller fold protein YncE/mono/diheme cytochrome c family protein
MSVPAPTIAPAPRLEVRSGSALARSPDDRFLIVVDEDAAALHRVALPLGSSPPSTVKLPGRPAQVVTDGQSVWVTVRDPSLLWVGQVEGLNISERTRIALPGDAWGLALTEDGKRALVTSAWTHQVSLVDLTASRALWSLSVAREPRGVVIDRAGSSAYVTHLVGSDVTAVRLSDPPEARRLLLTAAPLRAPSRALSASLGYAAVLSPDETRLFAARHALGALGKNSWFGAATVDAWSFVTHAAVLAPRASRRLETKSELAAQLVSGSDTATPGSSLTPFTQPRALVYRSTTQTLLVAGEGDDRIAELDALAPDPTLGVVALYPVSDKYHSEIHVAARCAAPAGVSLSTDERKLWVYCRATNDLAEVLLREPGTDGVTDPVSARLDLGDDPLGPGGATGRKLFYAATDHVVSGGLGCAGCHPEGRDDGHTWHEAKFTTEDGEASNFLGRAENIPSEAHTQGVPRRTPMLAGRVNAKGPYGWHAESPSLIDREVRGFALHRWGGVPERAPEQVQLRATALADFLRRGLVPPPQDHAPLTDAAQRGRVVFLDPAVGCASCHAPASGYTTREAFALPTRPPPAGYDPDPIQAFKIPALSYLAGRAPYFHDGSAASLSDLIERNGTRMGNTKALTAAQRGDLVAFLETL